MRICVLNPSYEGSASPFKGHDPVCDPSRWWPDQTWSRVSIRKDTAGAQIRDAIRSGVDVFINLCDGAWDEDRAGIDVVRLLETLDVPFTGATSSFYEPTREAMKRACRYQDIDVPAYRFATTRSHLEQAAQALQFPLIAKHPSSYGSIGMTKASRVADREALLTEGQRMIDRFGEVLVEEFIDGREFTVLVSEDADGGAPHTYTPVECRFPAGESFKHFDLKWVDFQDIAWFPVDDPALAERLRDATARMFVGLGGTGYGRADLRMDAEGRIYALEMNPNPGIFYPDGECGSADMILDNDPAGHRVFIERIVRTALARHARARTAFVIRDNAHGGYGMFAARDLAEGAMIDPWEGRPHRLVSRKQVDRWTGRLRDWFDRYAWPIGDDVFAIWHEDPMQWRPIDHSCDPNAWVDGLDLVARRAIRAGEPITCDYGTFCGDDMAAFQCACGSPACRVTIRGGDWRLTAMEAYGDYLSPYVAALRKREI